jgi:hypothetical protein
MDIHVMARSSTQLPTNTYTINASACLLAAYAYLFTLMDFYALLMLLTFAACLCTYVCLCTLMYVICLLMVHNISEGIFYWNYGLGKKGK